jgi:hypothetical protein
LSGTILDSHSPVTADKFNSVVFALAKGNTTTAMNLKDVYIDLVDVLVKIDGNNSAAVKSYALEQNYPNPFNPSTIIKYSLPKNSHVTIKVYDMLGRLVQTLVDENQLSNRYSVEWNAANVSTGVYFYRIKAESLDKSGEFTDTKKLMLIK